MPTKNQQAESETSDENETHRGKDATVDALRAWEALPEEGRASFERRAGAGRGLDLFLREYLQRVGGLGDPGLERGWFLLAANLPESDDGGICHVGRISDDVQIPLAGTGTYTIVVHVEDADVFFLGLSAFPSEPCIRCWLRDGESLAAEAREAKGLGPEDGEHSNDSAEG